MGQGLVPTLYIFDTREMSSGARQDEDGKDDAAGATSTCPTQACLSDNNIKLFMHADSGVGAAERYQPWLTSLQAFLRAYLFSRHAPTVRRDGDV